MGVAHVNLAKMVTDDINAHGGLLGRPVELYVEDSATDDEIAHRAAARLVREADVDVVIGGIYSSTRQAIKRPVVDEAAKLYIYPEQYEGQESRGDGYHESRLEPLVQPDQQVRNIVRPIRREPSLGLPNLACILLKDESERRNFILREVAERKMQAF